MRLKSPAQACAHAAFSQLATVLVSVVVVVADNTLKKKQSLKGNNLHSYIDLKLRAINININPKAKPKSM